MIDVLQMVPLRPEVQKELEARYRVHPKSEFEKVAGIVRGCVTNGHAGPPPDWIDRMPKLEVIASASVGYDGIPVEYARSKGIPVTNTPDVLNDDVADLAIGLMIMTARRLVVSERYVRAGRWPKEGEYPLAYRASGKRVYGVFPTKEDPKSSVIWEAFQPQTEPRRSYRRSGNPYGDEGAEADPRQQQLQKLQQLRQRQQRQVAAQRPRSPAVQPQPSALPTTNTQ